MLQKLFQRHEAFACHMLTDEKASKSFFDHFMTLSGKKVFSHAIFGHGKQGQK